MTRGHIHSPAELEKISRQIKAGLPPPKLPPERMAVLEAAAGAFRYMMIITLERRKAGVRTTYSSF